MTPAALRTRLVMVRHGETTGNSSIRYHGRTDVPLSDLGRRQMRAAAQALADFRFDHVFSSSMSRAEEGALLIASHNGDRPALMPPSLVPIDEFAEIDFGLFEGMTVEEISARYPDDYERWIRMRGQLGYRFPSGESRTDFQQRVQAGLARMFEHWRRGTAELRGCALLVAHRGVIRTIARTLAGCEPVIELGSIHIFDHDGTKWKVAELDRVGYLG